MNEEIKIVLKSVTFDDVPKWKCRWWDVIYYVTTFFWDIKEFVKKLVKNRD